MKDKTGFLGNSSYSSIFTDAHGHLDPDATEQPAGDRNSPPGSPLAADKIAKGAELLSLFCDLDIWEKFLEREFEIADGVTVTRPIYSIWIREIRREFGDLLANVTSEADLYGLSQLVWHNTNTPWRASHATGTQWALLSTGKNLRWETVGLIFSLTGILVGSLSDWDAMFTCWRDTIKDRPTLARKLRDTVETCISFCKECETINDLFACLLFESTCLLGSVRGDAYYGGWQRMGETCDLIILMGLHQGSSKDERDSQISFFVKQLRINTFLEVYGYDKTMATFLGRPPRLSYRYCLVQLPLDLTDDEMLLEGQELEDAVSRLHDGWNTSNHFTRVTWRRVWSYYVKAREDILEISLGTNEDISERAQQISIELQQTHDNMPAFVKTDPFTVLARIQPSSHFAIPGWEADRLPLYIMHLVLIHCGMRHTAFLLKRALVNRNKADPKEMIPDARFLLQLVLQVIAKRDYIRDFQSDFTWLLAFHGLPSAGVLAIELLKQEQTRAYTPEILPRSETIQDLSVFISALATVGPGEGNHAICNQGRRALKRLLDKILSPEPVFPANAAATQQNGGAGGGGINTLDDSALYFPTGNDAEFLQWLDDVDWDRASWLGTV